MRPLQWLQQLALEDRWEVTRRHPYYLHIGISPNDFGRDRARRDRRHGCAAPPSTEASEFRFSRMGVALNDGAIAPLTYRSFARLLMDLPWGNPDASRRNDPRVDVAAWEKVDDAMVSQEVANKLQCLRSVDLDSYPVVRSSASTFAHRGARSPCGRLLYDGAQASCGARGPSAIESCTSISRRKGAVGFVHGGARCVDHLRPSLDVVVTNTGRMARK